METLVAVEFKLYYCSSSKKQELLKFLENDDVSFDVENKNLYKLNKKQLDSLEHKYKNKKMSYKDRVWDIETSEMKPVFDSTPVIEHVTFCEFKGKIREGFNKSSLKAIQKELVKEFGLDKVCLKYYTTNKEVNITIKKEKISLDTEELSKCKKLQKDLYDNTVYVS